MNIIKSIKSHPRRVGGACLVLIGVAVTLVVVAVGLIARAETLPKRKLWPRQTWSTSPHPEGSIPSSSPSTAPMIIMTMSISTLLWSL